MKVRLQHTLHALRAIARWTPLVLSSILLLALLIAWPLTYRTTGRIALLWHTRSATRASDRSLCLHVSWGLVRLAYQDSHGKPPHPSNPLTGHEYRTRITHAYGSPDPRDVETYWVTFPAEWDPDMDEHLYRPSLWYRMGFAYGFQRYPSSPYTGYDASTDTRMYVAPAWFIALILALLPARFLWTRPARRRAWARAAGLCPKCRYDLRAHITGGAGDKCPECGTPISQAPATSRTGLGTSAPEGQGVG